MADNTVSESDNNKLNDEINTTNSSNEEKIETNSDEAGKTNEEQTETIVKSPTEKISVSEPSNAVEPEEGGPPAAEDYKPVAKKKKKNNSKKYPSPDDSIDLEYELKKLKQRRINVAGAPKMPLNGYVRFMNDRREILRREQPQRTALEHTKIIGEEWQQLSDELKAPYLESAAKDKAIYHEELDKFFKEHPEVVANELAKAKRVSAAANVSNLENKDKVNTVNTSVGSNNVANSSNVGKKQSIKTGDNKRQSVANIDPDDIPLAQVKRTPTPPSSSSTSLPRPFLNSEIPIYTNEFIEHNKNVEVELRTLRKTKADLEQQNAVLEQHVENTKAGHAKVMGEVVELKEENNRLNTYINALRHKLIAALSGIDLPTLEINEPNVENIDSILASLVNFTSSMSGKSNPIFLKARDALRKLDMMDVPKP